MNATTDYTDIAEIRETYFYQRDRYAGPSEFVVNEALAEGWRLLAVNPTPGYENQGDHYAATVLYVLGRPNTVRAGGTVVPFGRTRA